MSFETYLVRQGLISPMQFVEAVELEEESRPQLGRIALEVGMLTMRQVFCVMSEQATSNKMFGAVAVEQGYLTQQGLAQLLFNQSNQATPLPQVLIEMGAIEAETLQQQLQLFYQAESEQQCRRTTIQAAARTLKVSLSCKTTI